MDIKGLTFLSGVELPDGSALFACQEGGLDQAKQPNTIVAIRTPDGAWEDGGYLEMTSAAVGQGHGTDALFMSSVDGKVLEYYPGNPVWTQLPTDEDAHQIRFLASVAGDAYAGGTDRVLYRQSRSGWELIGPQSMRESETSAGFEDLAGFGANELYAVGWNGEIWSNAHGGWQPISSPTNVILTAATAAPDRVYACGQVGVIVEGRGSDWRAVEHDVTEETLWSAATYDGTAYFAGDFGVLKIEDGEVEIAVVIHEGMRTAGALFTGPSGLWSVGATDIALFDGEDWRTIAQS